MEANLQLEKKLNVAAWIITVAVLGLVGLMRRVKITMPEGVDLGFLPPCINGCCSTGSPVFHQAEKSAAAPQRHLCGDCAVGTLFTVICGLPLHNTGNVVWR